jgi:hypothetical protein
LNFGIRHSFPAFMHFGARPVASKLVDLNLA